MSETPKRKWTLGQARAKAARVDEIGELPETADCIRSLIEQLREVQKAIETLREQVEEHASGHTEVCERFGAPAIQAAREEQFRADCAAMCPECAKDVPLSRAGETPWTHVVRPYTPEAIEIYCPASPLHEAHAAKQVTGA